MLCALGATEKAAEFEESRAMMSRAPEEKKQTLKFMSEIGTVMMEVDQIDRKGERLRMRGKMMGQFPQNIFISAEEMVQMVAKFTAPRVLLYFVLFPFFLLAGYLRKPQGKEGLGSFGQVIALLTTMFLLMMSYTYLGDHQLAGGGLLISFGLLFILATLGSGRRLFVYPSALLISVGYYLLANNYGADAPYFPLMAVPIVYILALFALAVRGTVYRDLVQPLWNAAYVGTYLWGFWTLYWILRFYRNDPWPAGIALVGFSLIGFVRYVTNLRVRHLYYGLGVLMLGVLLSTYQLKDVEQAYYGFPLLALGIVYTLIGVYLNRSQEYEYVSPFYYVGMVASIGSFFYGIRDTATLFPTLALITAEYVVVAWLMSKLRWASRSGESGFAWFAFFVANVAGYAAFVFLAFYRFPNNWGAIAGALVATFAFLKAAYDRPDTILQVRNLYLYIAGLFFTVAYFLILLRWDPVHDVEGDMLFVWPLPLLLMLYGYINERIGRPHWATTVYEGTYLSSLLAILLPFTMEQYAPTVAAVAAIFLFVTYSLFLTLSGHELLSYALPIFGAYWYYSLLNGVDESEANIGYYFVPIGIALMLLYLFFSYRRDAFSRLLLFSWLVVVAASVTAAIDHGTTALYLLTIWSVSFLVGAQFVRREAPTEEATLGGGEVVPDEA